ncbi:M23 family metallopeptidase [Bacteroides sp. 519]|uniref:M23 family metallopeptidase n=1 Tax=Bacteroides sp. 519 TaxID=2302937 RepID=UPI0013D22DCE|nr:M23 family metallopeptidase [Bacteroides sp. 519]NDV60687.1 M23 family peptidase [Bacteroides sp. 519]
MKKYIFPLFIFIAIYVNAQTDSRAGFRPPFDFPLYLSGNFGELRANHFHGGLDFKTQGATGKRVLALGDGYVSRIRVTHGSGHVLEINYDNGLTVIQRHDQGFVGEIARRVKKLQYEQESWEVDITPEPHEYPVKAGQHLSWSGNMGYSFGPHLHLEFRETESRDYVDPLPFFKTRIKDTTAPKVQGFMLFPQIGEGVVNSASTPQVFSTTNKDTIRAWGVIGAGIKAYDYMDGTQNRYGVYSTMLIVDGEEVFQSTVDKFSSYEDRMINSWTHGQYMKSFIDPGNTLRMLKASNDNRGLITINEERDYHFLYILKDVYGNTTRFNFVVKGKKDVIPPSLPKNKYYFAWNTMNYLYEPGMALVVPQKMLYKDVHLNYTAHIDSNAIAYVHQLNDERIPLHGYSDLRIGVRNMLVADTSKYYIARVTDKGKLVSVGGTFEDGYVKTRIRELATYTVAVDTVAPKVEPVAKKNWAKNGKIIYKITEEETGIKSYRGTIDGKYALFYLRITTDQLICDLDPDIVKKGGTHTLELKVVDNCGNETVLSSEF